MLSTKESDHSTTYCGLMTDFGYENANRENELFDDELTNVPLTHNARATYGVMSMRTKNELQSE